MKYVYVYVENEAICLSCFSNIPVYLKKKLYYKIMLYS